MGDILSIPDSNPRTMNKFKILIVDDNDFFRQTLKTALHTSFPTIAVDEAENGGKKKVRTIKIRKGGEDHGTKSETGNKGE